MRFLAKLKSLLSRRKLEAEMAEEIRLHLEQRTREHITAGMSPDDARYAALRKFGGVEQAKERAREQRFGRWMDETRQDLRYAFRAVRKQPGFTAVIVLTLALGLGLNTTIFSFLNALALRPPPVPDGEELVRVHGFAAERGRFTALTYPDFAALREQATTFAELTAFGGAGDVMMRAGEGGGAPEKINELLVSGNYFEILRAPFALGRGFRPDTDTGPDRAPVVVLSYRFWQERFGGDPTMIGRSIVLNDRVCTVVGVTGAEFRSPRLGGLPDLFVPMALQPELARNRENRLQSRDNFWLQVYGRLKPGVTRAQAQEELAVIVHRLDLASPRRTPWQIRVLRPSLVEPNELRGESLVAGAMLFAGPLLLLLIACANVGNLLLARAATRTREIAIRLSLGAGRSRLVRQFLAESLLFGVLGGAGGLLLSAWLSQVLAVFVLGESRAGLLTLTPDGRVAAFTAAISLLTPLLFGLAPALRASRLNLSDAVKHSGISSHNLTKSRLQNFFVIGQVALSFVLLIVAGLLVRSLHKAFTVEPGIALDRLVAIVPELRQQGYDPARAAEFHRALAERLRARPAVQSVTATHYLPGTGQRSSTDIRLPDGRKEIIRFNRVGADYFALVGLPLRTGRTFTAAEASGGAALSVVTETAAGRLWPGENPLGKRYRIGQSGPEHEVIGVVPNVPNRVLLEDEPEFYQLLGPADLPGAALLVRTELDPAAVLTTLAGEVRALDSRLRPTVFALAQKAREQTNGEKTLALLASAIGGLALLLASIGLYGVIAFFVSQRTAEFGVRVALGATRRDVLRLVVGRGVRVVLWGSAVGTVVALLVTQSLRRLLFGVTPADPATFVGVAVLLTGVALLAGLLPARRATKVDPLVALRCE